MKEVNKEIIFLCNEIKENTEKNKKSILGLKYPIHIEKGNYKKSIQSININKEVKAFPEPNSIRLLSENEEYIIPLSNIIGLYSINKEDN